jgi:hypothetical protein
MGASIDPVLMSKSGPAAGRFRSVSSDKGVYALTPRRMQTRSSARRNQSIMNVVRQAPDDVLPIVPQNHDQCCQTSENPLSRGCCLRICQHEAKNDSPIASSALRSSGIIC